MIVQNQDAFREAGAFPYIIDIINGHAREFRAEPKNNEERGQHLIAAVRAVNILTSKNGK